MRDRDDRLDDRLANTLDDTLQRAEKSGTLWMEVDADRVRAIVRHPKFSGLHSITLLAKGGLGPEIVALLPLANLERISLPGWGIGDDGLAQLLRAPRLKTLALGKSSNRLPPTGKPPFQALFTNEIGDIGYAALANSALRLDSLDLSYSVPSSDGLLKLLQSPVGQNLRELKLISNYVCNSTHIAALGDALEVLTLQHCKLDAACMRALAKRPLREMHTLDISINSFGDDGAIAVAAAPWPKLASLNVSGCLIGEAGMRALGKRKGIKRIGVANNNLYSGERESWTDWTGAVLGEGDRALSTNEIKRTFFADSDVMMF